MTKNITVKGINYEKETYWCNNCKKFHRYLFQGKPSITHLEHFCYISRYKYEFSQSELFKLGFKKSWKNKGVRISKGIKKEGFINE